jgi:hypothetical protein
VSCAVTVLAPAPRAVARAVHSIAVPPAVTRASAFPDPALERRDSPLLAAADGRQGHLSRPAALGRRGFPGPASTASPHHTPVPTPAHLTPRAIRVRRSPR